MIVPAEKSQQIVNAFSKYLKTQDESLINGFKLEDIKFALLHYNLDKNFPFYKAMGMRIEDLKEKKSQIAEEERMPITEGDIQKYTPKQILKVLFNLSLGAWLWLIGIMGSLYGIGYSIGFDKGKAERITSGDVASLQGLTVEQLILLREIWTYQKIHKLNKVIIVKDGFVFDDVKREETKINLAEKVLGDRGSSVRFEELIVSMPTQFLKLIPETRLGSPYVVSVPQEVGKILDKD